MPATSVDSGASLQPAVQNKAPQPALASPLAASAFPWHVVGRAGEGATAVVYKAEHATTGATAALKVLRKDLGELALREIALLGKLDRRWGPSLLDAGVIPSGTPELPGGSLYVATAWIDGRAIDPRRAADRERLAAQVAHGVGRALAELHEAGVRHGDVKPANIVLSEHPPRHDAADDRACTLVDLGLAARIGADGLRGGTPRYLAPEALERLDAGPEADLFALGAVLAEILAPDIESFSEVQRLTRLPCEPARSA